MNQAHLLLNPKAAKKQAAKHKARDPKRVQTPPVANGEGARGSNRDRKALPSSQDTDSPNTLLTSPSKTAMYDPRALLNPKGVGKAPSRAVTEDKRSLYTENSFEEPSTKLEPFDMQATQKRLLVREDSTPKSMLEGLYGVERRTDLPRKKAKVTTQDTEAKTTSSNPQSRHKGGIVSEYMKPNADGNMSAATLSNLVDLTQDDDDDDVQFVKARSTDQVQVCFGQVLVEVQAHAIPNAKQFAYFEGSSQWPPITCTLSRIKSKDAVVEVSDHKGFNFGRLNASAAICIAPVMDGLQGIRLQARLLNRKREPMEKSEEPCSKVMKLTINIYGHRVDGHRVGKHFGQHNFWFRTPTTSDPGIPVENPHVGQRPKAIEKIATPNRIVAETRTVEEATQAVSKLFDHSALTSNTLEETEACQQITTSLLAHQKQALTFMLKHEKPRTYGDNEEDNSSLWRKLQKSKGVNFYQDVVSGLTLDQEPEEVYGGLLADVMGLGKSLSALALIVGTKAESEAFAEEKLTRKDDTEKDLKLQVKTTLLICPMSTIKNWEDQIAEHIEPGALTYHVYHGQHRVRNPYMLSKFDVVISTYGTIAADFTSRHSGGVHPIHQLKWFRVVLDEAHTIREPKTTQSQAIYALFAQRRWALTGTPIQNRIEDLGSLTRFLRLQPYHTAAGFNQYVRAPAQSGDPAFLKSLRVFVDAFTLRRLKDRIDLPNKIDQVVSLEFSKEERRLHDFFKDRSHIQVQELTRDKEKNSGVQHHILKGIMTLRLISAHGRELLNDKDLEVLKGISAEDAIDLEEEPRLLTITVQQAYESLALMAEADLDTCKSCDKKISGESPSSENANDEEKPRCFILPCHDILCADCFKGIKQIFDIQPIDEPLACPTCSLAISPEYVPVTGSSTAVLDRIPEDNVDNMNAQEEIARPYGGPHTKTLALLQDLAQMKLDSEPLVANGEPPIKCVVFSEFTSHLNLIEIALDNHGFSYVRIDGTMQLNKRKVVLDAFATDDNVTILLASIKAAGQGLNLTSASRAFIMEPMWNPAAEAQAVDRIYRIGQKREVFVKRYIMAESIEGKIVELQKKKQKLADISMNRNHSMLSKKEVRDQHMKDILALFK